MAFETIELEIYEYLLSEGYNDLYIDGSTPMTDDNFCPSGIFLKESRIGVKWAH
jgi:hypothetical protein